MVCRVLWIQKPIYIYTLYNHDYDLLWSQFCQKLPVDNVAVKFLMATPTLWLLLPDLALGRVRRRLCLAFLCRLYTHADASKVIYLSLCEVQFRKAECGHENGYRQSTRNTSRNKRCLNFVRHHSSETKSRQNSRQPCAIWMVLCSDASVCLCVFPGLNCRKTSPIKFKRTVQYTSSRQLRQRGGHSFLGEEFEDFQLPFPDLFQQRFTMLENVYGFI